VRPRPTAASNHLHAQGTHRHLLLADVDLNLVWLTHRLTFLDEQIAAALQAEVNPRTLWPGSAASGEWPHRQHEPVG